MSSGKLEESGMADYEAFNPPNQPAAEPETEAVQNPPHRFSLTVLRAALFPERLGRMEQPDGYARAQGHCGDLMTFYLRIEDERITQITFTTDGCDATIASGEMLASMVEGVSLAEAGQVTPEELLAALEGLPPNHVHCAGLAVATLRAAIAGYRKAQIS
jgi:nitrogen fixation NifU-like protein